MRARVSRIDVANPNVEQEARVDADLNTLVTALYVQVDDLLKANPDRVPWRPLVGIATRISDAELVTLAVAQSLLGFTSEALGCEVRAIDPPTSESCSRTCPGSPGTTSGCASWSAP